MYIVDLNPMTKRTKKLRTGSLIRLVTILEIVCNAYHAILVQRKRVKSRNTVQRSRQCATVQTQYKGRDSALQSSQLGWDRKVQKVGTAKFKFTCNEQDSL